MADEAYKPTIDQMTEGEAHLMSQGVFEYEDSIATADQALKLAGFLARSAIDIARYERSLINHPEKNDHYLRLLKATGVAATVRANHFSEYDQTIPVRTQAHIDAQNWDNVQFKPVVRLSRAVGGVATEMTVEFLTREQQMDTVGRPEFGQIKTGSAHDTTAINCNPVEVVSTSLL